MLTLYDYWRSSASYRVRIALEVKELEYQKVGVNIAPGVDQQFAKLYQMVNPNKLVPCLEDGELQLHQSLTIIEYLDDKYSENGTRLIPEQGTLRYEAKSLALDICCDIHPLNNLRVLKQLSSQFGCDEQQKQQWYTKWLTEGFTPLEQRLSQYEGKFSLGDAVTVVDCCLIPQLYNAHRFHFDMSNFPRLSEIEQNCLSLASFKRAIPSKDG